MSVFLHRLNSPPSSSSSVADTAVAVAVVILLFVRFPSAIKELFVPSPTESAKEVFPGFREKPRKKVMFWPLGGTIWGQDLQLWMILLSNPVHRSFVSRTPETL